MTLENLRPSALRRFSLLGVHGYKDISIFCESNAAIIVAENGTGKTTALNAMDAFLNKRFYQLAGMHFDFLEFQFAGEEVFRAKRALFGAPKENISEQIQNIASMAEVSDSDVIDFISGAYQPQLFEKLKANFVIRRYYLNSPHDYDECKEIFDALYVEITSGYTDELKNLSGRIQN